MPSSGTRDNGVINFDHDSASAVKVTHSNFIAQNDGIMNISGTGAVAMEGDKNAQLVNNGTINLVPQALLTRV